MSGGDLATLQQLPLETKVLWALQRITEAFEYADANNLPVQVSYSGGKDSTVLRHLARMVRPDIPAVFVNTGLEFPEVVEFARLDPYLVELRPKTSFKSVLEKYGYPVVSKKVSMGVSRYRNTTSQEQKYLRMYGGLNPTSGRVQRSTIPPAYHYLLDAPFKISEYCCNALKKQPLSAIGGLPLIGTLAVDSEFRRMAYRASGCNVFTGKKSSSRPLSIWTEQDILRFILDNSIPIAPVYGQIVETDGVLRCTGEDRTGCIFCLFGIFEEQRKRGCNRFQRMYTTHPQLWSYCMTQLGVADVMKFLGLPTVPEGDTL